MKVVALKVLTLLVLLTAALVANPPPGQFLGNDAGIAVWGTLVGLAAVGGVLTLALTGRRGAWVAAALLPLPLIGPVQDFGTTPFVAAAVGGWALVLHLELMTFAQRKANWARRLAQEPGAVGRYERAYARSFRNLAAATLAGLALLVAAFWALRAVAPTTFALSLEARHVEGMAGFLAVLLVLVTAVVLLVRRPHQAGVGDTPPDEHGPAEDRGRADGAPRPATPGAPAASAAHDNPPEVPG